MRSRKLSLATSESLLCLSSQINNIWMLLTYLTSHGKYNWGKCAEHLPQIKNCMNCLSYIKLIWDICLLSSYVILQLKESSLSCLLFHEEPDQLNHIEHLLDWRTNELDFPSHKLSPKIIFKKILSQVSRCSTASQYPSHLVGIREIPGNPTSPT